MKTFKGTPGKWEVYTSKQSNSDGGGITEIYLLQESGGCFLCVNDGDDNYDIPRDLANAYLIAQAPELLKCLENMLNEFGYLYKNYAPDPEYPVHEIKCVKKAHEVINKALGLCGECGGELNEDGLCNVHDNYLYDHE